MNEQQKEIFSNVTGYGPDDCNNLFDIEMNVLNEKHIKACKEHISNSEMIIFKQGGSVEEMTVRPGRRITRNVASAGGSTLTIRARTRPASTGNAARIPGFIMSGHAVPSVGGTVWSNNTGSTRLGTVAQRQVSGRLDSAFVQTNNNITLSNLIQQNSHALTSATSTAAEIQLSISQGKSLAFEVDA